MDMNDGIALVELFHDRPECGVTEPRVVIACKKADAVGLERIVGVGDLFQRRIDIGQGHRREETKPGRMILHELGSILITGASQTAGHSLVAEP